MLAIRFYDVIVALHVMAIVIAFGVAFTYPVVLPWLRQNHPGSMVVVHSTQARIGRLIIGPAAAFALLAGAYLASDAGVWSEVWVAIPLLILVAILGISGGVLGPLENRLITLASAPDAPEYDAAFRRMMLLVRSVAVGVLIAIFFMVTKAGA